MYSKKKNRFPMDYVGEAQQYQKKSKVHLIFTIR